MQRASSNWCFVSMVAIGIGSVTAGWVYGACHQTCDDISCRMLSSPPDPTYPCLKTSNAQCHPDNWIRDISGGVCVSTTGPYDLYKCLFCDEDCPDNLPSAASPCSSCTKIDSRTTYQHCVSAG